MIVPSAPNKELEAAGLMFVTALNSATERFWVYAPYFVPDEAVMKALTLAAAWALLGSIPESSPEQDCNHHQRHG